LGGKKPSADLDPGVWGPITLTILGELLFYPNVWVRRTEVIREQPLKDEATKP
jgi:hypothetical protein